MNYWLMKNEPDDYSIDDLANESDLTEHWDGIRNYQVRNFMRDDMKVGDLGFFYHSNCDVPGVVGIMKICKEAYPDHTAFDPDEKYFDPKSDPENPRWLMVDVRFVRKLKRIISLKELREHPRLADMRLLQKGNRLSVTPIDKKQWYYILRLE